MTILNKQQAETIYGAMVALNNLSGIISATIPVPNRQGDTIKVSQSCIGAGILVSYQSGGAERHSEWFANQNDFAEIHNLE